VITDCAIQAKKLGYANSMPRFCSCVSQIARTPLKNARKVICVRQKMLSHAYRLRKKCAANVHFFKKDRESDRYNFFHFVRLPHEKSRKIVHFAIFVNASCLSEVVCFGWRHQKC
jgi:hypothetical protein